MKIAVAGATGFVGTLLVPKLAQGGHEVVALSRSGTGPEIPRVQARAVDIGDAEALRDALAGVEACYYLVHSMGMGDEFVQRDLELARGFATAAAEAGVGRIIYQGALGRGQLSRHLASRHEVGEALGSAGVPVVELRAAVILGSGSISFEMMRYLSERLPVMICPRWVRTPIEPVAVSDVLEYLVGALEVRAGVYEIGCGETTTYQDMIQLYAGVRGLRRRKILNLPMLNLKLSAYWVDLVTPLDRRVTHSLIDSMSHPVTVDDAQPTRDAFGIAPVALEPAMRKALDDQAEALSQTLFEDYRGPHDTVYRLSLREPVPHEASQAIRDDLGKIGGDLSWYGWPWAWRARFVLGLLLGENHRMLRPDKVAAGTHADWWTIAASSGDSLVLRSRGWATGDGWLGYRMPSDAAVLTVAAAFRPCGLPGFLYWFLLTPVHKLVFRAMAKARIRRARPMAR